MSDQALYLNCGPEISVAATKSFTAQLCILYQLAYALDNNLQDGKSKLLDLSLCGLDQILRLLFTTLPALAHKMRKQKRVLLPGQRRQFCGSR